MPKQRMVALKPLTYATRRLQAGDQFEAVFRDARVLKAIGKARDDYETVAPAAPLADPAQPEPGSLDALRAEAEAAGVHVDRRWGEGRLRQEIASAGRQKPPESASEPRSVSAMTTTNTSLAPSPTVSGAVNVGSTAHPVYRRSDD